MNENNRPTDDAFDSNEQRQNNIAETDAGKHSASSEKQRDSYAIEGSPDGREYITPGGSHGYVYTPENAVKSNSVRRKILIASCITGVLIMLMGFCFLGAWLALTSDRISGNGNSESDSQYAFEVPGTSDGLVIMEGDAPQDSADQDTSLSETVQEILTNAVDAEAEDSVSQVVTEQQTTHDNENALEDAPSNSAIPGTDKATISKKTSERVDANNDGKADTVFDEEGSVITSAGDTVMSTATVVAKISASVVEISTETVVQSSREQYTTGGAGSGIIIAKEGYIVTNHHVIDGADNITVRLNNGKKFNATLVGTDEATDIAVLLIDAGDYELTVAPLGCSYDLVAGEDIIAIGNPLGSLGGTVTEGIVSATARRINMDGNVMTLLQISAPINPGNSGGGLFNMAGELVGVVNAKVASEDIEGLGFAIPVDVAYDIICQLIEYRYVKGRITTGLTLMDVTSSMTAMQYFSSRYTGVYITESTVCTELQYGDRILTVNGQEIAQATDVKTAISGKGVGDTVEIVVYRKNQQVTVTLTLAEYVPSYVTQTE